MGYYNPIYIYGVDRFLADASAAGVDGLIVVDLPPEEDEELCLPALAGRPQLHPPGDADHRRQAPADRARRTPRASSTTSRSPASPAPRRRQPARGREAVERIKRHTDLPVVVGFGVKTPEQAAAIGRIADGVVVGSALVRRDRGDASTPATGRRPRPFKR